MVKFNTSTFLLVACLLYAFLMLGCGCQVRQDRMIASSKKAALFGAGIGLMWANPALVGQQAFVWGVIGGLQVAISDRLDW